MSNRATDEELLRSLYHEHAGFLTRYVQRLVGGDVGRAEDVVQETLLRAWRHPRSLDAEGASVRGWLVTVARNVVIDFERARQRRPSEVSAELMPDAADSALDVTETVLRAIEIDDALQGLVPSHRAVIESLYHRDRSVADTANLLGIPQGTVKSRAFYALRALRVAFEERGLLP